MKNRIELFNKQYLDAHYFISTISSNSSCFGDKSGLKWVSAQKIAFIIRFDSWA